MMLLHRAQHEFQTENSSRGCVAICNIMQNALVYYPRHIELPFSTVVGVGLRLPHPKNITVNSSARIGTSCTIYHNVTIGALEGDANAAPTIQDDVIIGTGAVVLGPVTIGSGAKIGANAVVTRDVPAGATVIGTNHLLRK
ncbi:serine acetyltransferase [Kocuria sp. KH4]